MTRYSLPPNINRVSQFYSHVVVELARLLMQTKVCHYNFFNNWAKQLVSICGSEAVHEYQCISLWLIKGGKS